MNSSGIAYQPKETIQQMQEQKLQQLLLYIQDKSPFYKQLFAKNSVDVSSVKTLEDLSRLPFTTKEDLQTNNDSFLCVDKRSVIEYTSTSGTLGSPVVIPLTESDLQRLADNEYNSFITADGSADDIYQLMLTLDRQFMAGIAYYSGIRKMGGGIIRVGPGVPALQWHTILQQKPTAIVAVPSFILKLLQYAGEHSIDVNRTSVQKAVCIGENIRNSDLSLNALGKKILELWDIRLYSTYASTEMQTAFTECGFGCGGHLNAELLIVEILDENNKPVAANTPGEVTITTLGVEGAPLLRYKTGDVCMYFDEPCQCGRNTLRLSSVIGRKQQMIKFKGTSIYPSALFDLLNEMAEVNDYVVEASVNDVGLDEVLVYIYTKEMNTENDYRIRSYLQARLRVNPFIKYVSEEDIKKMQVNEASRKITKFIDKRLNETKTISTLTNKNNHA